MVEELTFGKEAEKISRLFKMADEIRKTKEGGGLP